MIAMNRRVYANKIVWQKPNICIEFHCNTHLRANLTFQSIDSCNLCTFEIYILYQPVYKIKTKQKSKQTKLLENLKIFENVRKLVCGLVLIDVIRTTYLLILDLNKMMADKLIHHFTPMLY